MVADHQGGRDRRAGAVRAGDGSVPVIKMNVKTVLISGSTDGVGRYVAAKLAVADARVLIHGRDSARHNPGR